MFSVAFVIFPCTCVHNMHGGEVPGHHKMEGGSVLGTRLTQTTPLGFSSSRNRSPIFAQNLW